LILFVLAAFIVSSPAQWIRLKIVRDSANKDWRAESARRRAEGRPDFSGIWQIVHPPKAINEG
jgi:hypothetical protein